MEAHMQDNGRKMYILRHQFHKKWHKLLNNNKTECDLFLILFNKHLIQEGTRQNTQAWGEDLRFLKNCTGKQSKS